MLTFKESLKRVELDLRTCINKWKQYLFNSNRKLKVVLGKLIMQNEFISNFTEKKFQRVIKKKN